MSKTKNDDEENVYILSPWGCLYTVLRDYGVDTTGITGAIGEHMVEDFMDSMCKQGHVEVRRTGQTCKTCKWHDDFSWVCFNGDSEHRADFTNDDDSCGEWESDNPCTE